MRYIPSRYSVNKLGGSVGVHEPATRGPQELMDAQGNLEARSTAHGEDLYPPRVVVEHYEGFGLLSDALKLLAMVGDKVHRDHLSKSLGLLVTRRVGAAVRAVLLIGS